MTGCVYVAQGARILKVGRTSNAKGRMYSIKKEFAKYGDAVTDVHFGDATHGEHRAEIMLIRKVAEIRKPFFGREWFESGDFAEVVAIAQDATKDAQAWHPKPVKELSKAAREKIKQERVAKEEKRKADNATAKIRHKAEAKQRAFRRLLRNIEVACRAMWASKQPAKAA